MLEPFGEVGTRFSLQLSSRTQFVKIKNKKVIFENQCENLKELSLMFLKQFFEKVNIAKSQQRTTKVWKNQPTCKELKRKPVTLIPKSADHDCSRRQILRHLSSFSKEIRNYISWESSASRRFSWNIMPYLLFLKRGKIWNCCLLQIVGGALWVKFLHHIFLSHAKPVFLMSRCSYDVNVSCQCCSWYLKMEIYNYCRRQ